MQDLLESQFTLEKPAASAESLTPILILDSEKKADVLISLLGVYYGNISSWTSQSYQMVTWSIGLSFAVVAYMFLNPNTTMPVKLVIAVGLLAFGLMIQLFLRRASRAHHGNRLAISKCEAALGLYQPGEYLKDRKFFIYSKEMLQSKNLQFLIIFQLIATGASVCFVIFEGLLI